MTSIGDTDPYLVPAFSLSNRALRAVWGFVYVIFFRTSPRPFHAWRAFLLRCFGAKLGKNCHIYARARIWAPWNLECDEQATIGDEAIVYNPARVTLGSHAIISQQAYLCGATHDYEDPKFPLISFPISIGSYAWICARATVQPGVSAGEGAVLALGSGRLTILSHGQSTVEFQRGKSSKEGKSQKVQAAASSNCFGKADNDFHPHPHEK